MTINQQSTPEDLRKKFFALRSMEDLANLLEISVKKLNYYLYRISPEQKYTFFEIPKKSGGSRKISAPVRSLKIIQSKLKKFLEAVYQRQAPVHGFVIGYNIKSNAEAHMLRPRKYVFNVDIKDFFPSINFGRVRGLFMAKPYNLPDKVATVLAQICCFNNSLPQGAPTSPILANMICARMDAQLLQLAKTNKCTYTRYADDITFSTSIRNFPHSLAYMEPLPTGQQLTVGKELKKIIETNGFEINRSKVRLQTTNMRQEITGITVNKFPNVQREYISQIRAMIHAWQKFGLENAEQEYRTKYAKKHRSEYNQANNLISFKAVVGSKIGFLGMIRGKDDLLYTRFRYQFKRLNGGVLDTVPEIFISYSRKDRAFALKLVDSLSSKGINAWLDVKDILSGMDWIDALNAGEKICKGTIVIITPSSMASPHVKDEWFYFFNANKPVLTALLKTTPDIPSQLNRWQHTDFRETEDDEIVYNRQLEILVATLKQAAIIK